MTCLPNRPLRMWRDITPSPSALVPLSRNSAHLLVIGGGVTGLVTSWVLLDRGYRVTILAKEWASHKPGNRLTSQIAGALWEYPPAVCGKHTDKISLDDSKRWAMVSYPIWEALAEEPAIAKSCGVRMMPADFFFPTPLDEDICEAPKLREILSSGVKGFRRDIGLVEERSVDPHRGGVDAYEIMSPVIDTDRAMMFLMNLVKSKGAELVTEEILRSLHEVENDLRKRFNADIIINCAGLASTQLADDTTCFPVRGGLLRVINDGRDFPKVEAALVVTAGAVHNEDEIIFILPRNENILLVGGFAESNKWDTDLEVDSPIVQRMRKRCEEFLPDLRNARLDSKYPLAQGLRPFRSASIRVEREKGNGEAVSRIIHSYGHGGSGWTVSFGCAGDVADIVRDTLESLENHENNKSLVLEEARL